MRLDPITSPEGTARDRVPSRAAISAITKVPRVCSRTRTPRAECRVARRRGPWRTRDRAHDRSRSVTSRPSLMDPQPYRTRSSRMQGGPRAARERPRRAQGEVGAMRVLVAYATRHGATPRASPTSTAETLRADGLPPTRDRPRAISTSRDTTRSSSAARPTCSAGRSGHRPGEAAGGRAAKPPVVAVQQRAARDRSARRQGARSEGGHGPWREIRQVMRSLGAREHRVFFGALLPDRRPGSRSIARKNTCHIAILAFVHQSHSFVE